METATRLLFNDFVGNIAQINGIAPEIATSARFTVAPSIQQTLVTRMQDTIEFLKRINIVPVQDQSGAKIGLGIGSTIAGRTNTAGGTRRTGIDPNALDQFGYTCAQTNFDTALRYAKLDMWAKFPDFETKIRDNIVLRQALDRIMIGWNGTSVAAQTDRVANPLLQDVNIGWLEDMRLNAPAQVLSAVEGGKVANAVTYGAAGDYDSIDSMVWDAKETLLPAWVREDPNLVCIVGSELLHDKYFPLINRTEGSLDMMAREAIMADRQLGGLPVERVPYFPATAFMITTFDNLSLYYQDGKARRLIRDEPELDQVTDYQSSNEAYVIEDHQWACLVENIQQKAA